MDIGMSPIHDDEEPPAMFRRYGELYDLFAAPELPRDSCDIEFFPIEPYSDIFSMGMLFLFFLLPIDERGDPSADFKNLSLRLRNRDASPSMPNNVLVREPTAVFQPLWDLVQTMVGPPAARPSSSQVVRNIDLLRKHVEVC